MKQWNTIIEVKFIEKYNINLETKLKEKNKRHSHILFSAFYIDFFRFYRLSDFTAGFNIFFKIYILESIL